MSNPRTGPGVPHGRATWGGAQVSCRGHSYGSRGHSYGKGAPHVCHVRRVNGSHGDPAVPDPGHPRGGTRGAARPHHEHSLARPRARRRLLTGRAAGRDAGNFVTEIDGLDIHFIHVRSPHENALPVILTHGWPGSVIELLNIIDRLTNPTAHGGSAAEAFDVVIPSMPGYGYSGKPRDLGWGPVRTARAWDALMTRLGYTSNSHSNSQDVESQDLRDRSVSGRA